MSHVAHMGIAEIVVLLNLPQKKVNLSTFMKEKAGAILGASKGFLLIFPGENLHFVGETRVHQSGLGPMQDVESSGNRKA